MNPIRVIAACLFTVAAVAALGAKISHRAVTPSNHIAAMPTPICPAMQCNAAVASK